MEAFRKQASKLREQVAKQQQAVLKQLGHFNNDAVVADDDELQCHQQLQSLYNSTRAAKHLQRHIVRGVEGFVSTSKKQMEIVKRLAEECCKYGNEYHIAGYALANASLHFGTSHKSMEGERESLLGIIGQISEPLRTSIGGAPLDDARHLTHRYDQIRREVEAQAAEVTKRQFKSKEAGASSETAIRLQNAEARLTELRSTMTALGREATAAMLSVEDQQQQLTFQQLLTMVDAERSYHHAVADILEKLHAKMILEKEQIELASQSETMMTYLHAQPEQPDTKSKEFGDAEPEPANQEGTCFIAQVRTANQEGTCFIAQVVHPFDAQAEGELSLSVDDYVVVRQVTPDGWSEGECMGKAGWFPSAYIEKRDKAPASKVTEATPTPSP